MSAWWSSLSVRERALLMVAGALIGLVVYFLGLYRPLSAAAEASERRALAAIREAGAIEASASRLAAAPAPAAPVATGGSLRADASNLAAEAGLKIARMQPEGDRALTIVLERAPANLALGWIARLETERGIVVERLTIEQDSERAVVMEAVLVERGR